MTAHERCVRAYIHILPPVTFGWTELQLISTAARLSERVLLPPAPQGTWVRLCAVAAPVHGHEQALRGLMCRPPCRIVDYRTVSRWLVVASWLVRGGDEEERCLLITLVHPWSTHHRTMRCASERHGSRIYSPGQVDAV